MTDHGRTASTRELYLHPHKGLLKYLLTGHPGTIVIAPHF